MPKRRLLVGALAIATLGASVAVALSANAFPTSATGSYEAEAAENTLAGGARVVSCQACSGGAKVGWIGHTGTLRIAVTADAAGPATVTISYASGEPRTAELSVNDGTATALALPVTGGFDTPGTHEVPVTLTAGANTLTFGNPDGWAPDFDKVTVTTGAQPSPSVTVSPSTPPTESVDPITAYEAEVARLVNVERAAAGCPAITVDPMLGTAARLHSQDMAARHYFSHTTPEGVTFITRIEKAGYRWAGAGENIAKGQGDPAAVMAAWMNSEGHRANIVNCGFKDLGVGLAYEYGRTPVWTQNFGSPRNW